MKNSLYVRQFQFQNIDRGNSGLRTSISSFKSAFVMNKSIKILHIPLKVNGPRQANLVLIAYASSEGSGEPAHPRSLARTFAARS